MSVNSAEKTVCDVLVIGGGGAGLRAAIAAASSGADVLMVSKTQIGRATNTYRSKSFISSSGWGDPNDNSGVHSRDTLQGGRYLNNPDMVARFAEIIRSETKLLRKWGVRFGTGEDGRPAVTRFPGHTYARQVFGRNVKGSDLVIPLTRKAKEIGVRFQERTFVSSLMVSGSRVCGATGISKDGRFWSAEAKTIVLATGGFSHVFLNTTNAPGITGDGQALALKAGVALQDMEFVQFYPTALGKRGNHILVYERLLAQDGVVLRNSSGEDILKKNGYHVPADITRDQITQVIMKEILEDPKRKGTIDMDLGGLSSEAARAVSTLLPAQWSKGTTVFQVVPTTHFCMGGVVVDNHGETTCLGLFAAGEVSVGLHGANRLGGNALAEVIAMGGMAGKAAADKAMTLGRVAGFDSAVQQERARLNAMFKDQGTPLKKLIQELKETMWFNAGIIRDRQSLDKALETIMGRKGAQALVATIGDLIRFLEFRNIRLMGEVVCRSALERTESRGSHFRSDYPGENDDVWLKNIRVRKTDSGLRLEQIPVPGGD